jgi:hypothetical protein
VIYLRVKLELSLTSPFSTYSLLDVADSHPLQIATITQQHCQDEEHLKPWIDPHQLKCLNGTWYKEGQVVVTKDLEGKHNIIKVHHDPPVHGHPGIARQCNS